MQSLFLVALPRSLSTLTYQLLAGALPLRSPAWTSDGEILNLERHALFPGADGSDAHKFIPPETDPERFTRAVAFLEDAVHPEGFVYKDVVQPFVVAHALAGTGCRILRITRDPVDVAYAMRTQRWWYPAGAGFDPDDRCTAFVEGLLRAERALATIPGAVLDYEQLVRDEEHLWTIVRSLYPRVELRPRSYIDEAFARQREEILRRRETEPYRRLAALFEDAASRLAGQESCGPGSSQSHSTFSTGSR